MKYNLISFLLLFFPILAFTQIEIAVEAYDTFSKAPIYGFHLIVTEGVEQRVISNAYNESILTFETIGTFQQSIEIKIRKSGYQDSDLMFPISYDPRERRKKVALFPQENIIEGRILDSESEAPLQADLTLTISDTLLSDQSGTDGRFFFNRVLEGNESFRLKIEKEGYKPFSNPYRFRRVTFPMIIRLTRQEEPTTIIDTVPVEPAIIQGHIRDHKGNPAEGASVIITYTDGKEQKTNTDSEGYFIAELEGAENTTLVEARVDYPKHKPFITKDQLFSVQLRMKITDLELDKKRRLKNFLFWKGGAAAVGSISSGIYSAVQLEKSKGKENELWKTHFDRAEAGLNGAIILGVAGAGCLIAGVLLHREWKKEKEMNDAYFQPLLGTTDQGMTIGIAFKF